MQYQPGAFGRSARSAQDPGHRRGLRAEGAQHRDRDQGDHGLRRKRRQDGARGGGAGRSACRHQFRSRTLRGAGTRQAAGIRGEADRGAAARHRRALPFDLALCRVSRLLTLAGIGDPGACRRFFYSHSGGNIMEVMRTCAKYR